LKKLGILILTFLLVASIFVSGCASNDLTELNIGYQPSTHQIAYMTAAEKGWWKADLEPYGITKINEYQLEPVSSEELVRTPEKET